MKCVGWWEEYKCGCVSETVKHKKDLLGYCKFHGDDRRRIYPELVKKADMVASMSECERKRKLEGGK